MTALRTGPLARLVPPVDPDEPGVFERLLTRQLVTEEILAIEANGAGLTARVVSGGTDPTAVHRILADLIERVTGDVTIPESEIVAYYERNRDRYRIEATRRVRHILVADEPTARQVAAWIRAGARLEALARRQSLDTGSRDAGGDLGDVGRGVLSAPLEDAIFAAPVGTVVGPIESEHGWHVARVESIGLTGHVRYADVRRSIEAELLAAERERVFGDWLDTRRAELAVIAAEYAHPGDPVNGVPTHRH